MSRRRKFVYPGVPEEPGFYVYELWADETCLYVGRVGDSGPGLMYRRLGGHRSEKPWFRDVTRIVVSTFSTHAEMAAAEPRRIFELKPLHNRAYTGQEWAPDAQSRWDAYYGAYNKQPGRIAKERAREPGRKRYYAGRNALPEVKARKLRWARGASRRPGPGQAGLF